MLAELAKYFADGGVLMTIIVVAFLLGVGIAVAQLVLVRKIDLSPAVVGAILVLAGLGAMGALYGLYAGLSDFTTAPPGLAWVILNAGISVSLNTASLSAILCVPLVILSAVAVAIRQNLSRQTDPAAPGEEG